MGNGTDSADALGDLLGVRGAASLENGFKALNISPEL
jgi:hypothetical protein